MINIQAISWCVALVFALSMHILLLVEGWVLLGQTIGKRAQALITVIIIISATLLTFALYAFMVNVGGL
jgi:hypothetical protein